MTGGLPATKVRPNRSRAAKALHRPEDVTSFLEPVSDALLESARRQAEQQLAQAIEDARGELSRARAEAERLVAEAQAQGASAAEWIASLQLAEVRREARETILGARRRAYETLRRKALAALEERQGTPEGLMLVDWLSSMVNDRLGGGASVRRAGTDFLDLEAQSGNRRITVGPTLLVDHVLLSMTRELEELWA